MNTLTSLLLPVCFGLVAGVSHGIISHHHNLPVSLADQLLFPLQQESQPLFSKQ